MLFELHIKYKDGRTERPIVFAEKGSEIKVYPQRDNILAVGCRPYKYKVEKHPTLPVSIVRFKDKTMIYPAQIECHSKTTLDDIKVNEPKTKITNQERVEQPKTQEEKSWRFESSSGGGTYTVKQTKTGKLICDCPGVWRSKDRRCKHIKEVETY